jgi:hypothetical protein
LSDAIVTGRRLLNLCGDTPEAVAQTKAMLSNMSVEQLEAEAGNLATATKGMSVSQLTSAGSDDSGQQGNEADSLADNIIAMGSRKRHGQK